MAYIVSKIIAHHLQKTKKLCIIHNNNVKGVRKTMNKLLHVLVYVFLLLAGGSLFFEIQLNEKRTELTKRNRLQEDCFVSLVKSIEHGKPSEDASFEIKKDVSPVEAKIYDTPDMENLLADYAAPLEQQNLQTMNWDGKRADLRRVFVYDAEGKPLMDGNEPQTRDSAEDKLLNELMEAAKNQLARLNSTRAALTEMRGRLEAVVLELNKLKPEARQDKVTIVEKNEKIAKLEQEKAELEQQIVKLKAQIEELNTEIASLKDEVAAAKDETEQVKDELAKREKVIEQLKEIIKKQVQNREKSGAPAANVTTLPAGNKGKVIEADNENMFAIVEFTSEALNELRGGNSAAPLPFIELSIRRPGFKGPAGEFVGRVRIRQEVKGKLYVVCDILGSWEQDKVRKDDVIFAD